MVAVVLVVGLVVLAVSAAAFFVPALIRGLIDAFRPRVMLYVGAAIRIALGIVLLLAAPECRFTPGVQALGVITIVAGAVLLFIKESAADALFRWAAEMPNTAVRGFALVGVVLGGFLVYVAS